MENDIIEKALRIAAIAHDGQKRKEGDLPYITHPVSIAIFLAKRGFSDTAIAAALVHDVLEDTEYTEEEIEKELGTEVLSIVQAVSENKSLSWELRKTGYIEQILKGSADVKAVSTGDKIHNIQSMLLAHESLGNDFWKIFSRGKEKQLWFYESFLSMLKSSWDHPIVLEYERMVEKLRKLS